MSKRKRRHKRENNIIENNNPFNNNPFGINPNQLMGLLGGNFDFNQIGNLLSSMGNEGLNLSNFNLNNNQGNKNQFDFMNNFPLGNLNSNNIVEEKIINDEKINITDDEEEEIIEEDDEFIEEDENIQMLIAIKSIVDSKKANFIERIIEEYSKGTFK